MGWMASAPNWASRKRKSRDRRVEGSEVLWGLGCLKRCVRVGEVGGVWEWLWDFEDSVVWWLAFGLGDEGMGREGKGSYVRLTAAGLLSTVNKTASTASAIPSLIMLPSHSTSTLPPTLQCTVTQSMTVNAVLVL
jgi:hypothetical protein